MNEKMTEMIFLFPEKKSLQGLLFHVHKKVDLCQKKILKFITAAFHKIMLWI